MDVKTKTALWGISEKLTSLLEEFAQVVDDMEVSVNDSCKQYDSKRGPSPGQTSRKRYEETQKGIIRLQENKDILYSLKLTEHAQERLIELLNKPQ